MFEQSLYEPETVATPLAEGDLFHNYEIRNWDLGSRIYKIVGISAVANILAVLIVAQTSLLTLKGCDSPFVGSVCQVLDTVYVGSVLFGTDREYVDAVYEKTDLGDAEITFVDVTGVTPPLSYPEGYFQIANPMQFQAMLDAANNPTPLPNVNDLAGIPVTPPTTSGTSLFHTKPNIPRQNPDVIDGDLPTFNNNPTIATKPPTRIRKNNPGRVTANANSNKAPGKPDENDTVAANNSNTNTAAKIDPTPPVDAYDINKRPFVDLANNVNDLLDKKQVNLESAFVVNATGKLNKEGKLDPKSFKWGQIASQDVKMIDIVKEAITAINDSGYLQYLKDINGKDFTLMLQQDDINISAVVQSEMESEMRAKSTSSSLGLAIAAAKFKKSGENADQNDKDDLIVLENAKIETDGKKVIIRFLVPKEIALPLIQRKLAEQKAAPKTQNGTGTPKSGENNAKQQY